jgi:cephalosporin-C deacetylase-like acetyl esterase
MKSLRLFLFLAGAFVSAFAIRAAEGAKKPSHVLTVAADRSNALYQRGETVTFNVRLEHEGRPVDSGEIAWVLSKDGVEPRRTGRAQLTGGTATITGTLDEPGFLQCSVTFEAGAAKVTALGGAGISPLEIKPSLPVPLQFDAFWDAKKKALAAVPMNPRLTPVTSPREGIATFDLQADSIGAPVSGYFARPANARPRSLPAILTVPGAGVRSAGLSAAVSWAREGALALDINAHGLPNGRDAAFYTALAEGELKDYRRKGRESRETIYFLGMYLRLIRAIDFLTAQPEWDGRTVVVSGSSQGGAQAIAAAGLDERVSFFVAGVPAMCDHTGAVAGRIAGWPKFIETKERPGADVVAAVRYYDGVNFATRAKAPGFFTVGFIDTTCPPTSVYAAYNALTTKKEIHHDIAAGHTNTPAASAAMRAAVLRHFEAMRGKGQ